jgi:hypothetical protein
VLFRMVGLFCCRKGRSRHTGPGMGHEPREDNPRTGRTRLSLRVVRNDDLSR